MVALETIKTRMQIQGEVGKLNPQVVYRNAFHAFYRVARDEGIRGLQGGLPPALLFQLALNGTRLGFYSYIKSFYTNAWDSVRLRFGLGSAGGPSSSPNAFINLAAGATSGMCGAFLGSPFFSVKVRQQTMFCQTAQASQRPSSWAVAKEMVRGEGFSSLYRGVPAAMLRMGMGGAVQLATYDQSKHWALQAGFRDGVSAHLASSMIAGLFVVVAMNPMDVVTTRLYNQKVVSGQPRLYNSMLDCVVKTARHEGIKGFYKGLLPHYLRVGPHTTLTFLFWEQAKRLASQAGF